MLIRFGICFLSLPLSCFCVCRCYRTFVKIQQCYFEHNHIHTHKHTKWTKKNKYRSKERNVLFSAKKNDLNEVTQVCENFVRNNGNRCMNEKVWHFSFVCWYFIYQLNVHLWPFLLSYKKSFKMYVCYICILYNRVFFRLSSNYLQW